MCDPVTIATVATVTAVASTAYTGYATMQQQKYNAQVADVNAIYADRAARQAQEAGEQEEQAHAREVSQLRARQRADLGASGVDTTFGSPLDMLAETTVLGNEDAQRIRQNTENTVQGYRISAQNDNLQAAGQRAAAKATGFSTILNTGAAAIGGVNNVGTAIGKYGAPSWTGSVGQKLQKVYSVKK